ncbi:hypothetical protein PR202_gb25972 [Eleusine coracana subsp. coracana]|uniref:Uncharacterized protein n=1 Tax=Eleusine coracana subsp. coracana TaxID=191504 RepID=A0AAV5FS11_ELECO|nr:hypothetical protein PR202_gb25972 [Eleusine coracana subsp. coracana]
MWGGVGLCRLSRSGARNARLRPEHTRHIGGVTLPNLESSGPGVVFRPPFLLPLLRLPEDEESVGAMPLEGPPELDLG